MRKSLNDNPTVQIAVVGVLVVVVGLFFMMSMKKKSSPSTPASTAPGSVASATPSPETTAPTVVGGSATSSAGAVSAVGATPPVSGGTVSPDALIPGPGLPGDLVAAWKRNEAIALLIVRGGGIDDRMVRRSVESLSGDSEVAVFVTRAKHVARYSRITQGVGVSQVPALVVVRRRSESGSVPQAQLSYGFRSSQSVVQAVHDAVYSGRDDLPYSPR